MMRSLAIIFAIMLGSGCAQAQSSPDLVPALQRLAAARNAEAIYYLGMSYHLGLGVAKDPAKALDLFRKGAALGDPLAAYKLGCYYDGQGGDLVVADAAMALTHKLVAARAGYALAQQDVAAHYAGQGDIKTSLEWLERAAAQGWPDSHYSYALLHRGYAGMPLDRVKSVAYLRLYLARRDDPQARAALEEDEPKLSPAERAAASAIVAAYRPAPSPLTRKALSGLRAAEALVANAPKG